MTSNAHDFLDPYTSNAQNDEITPQKKIDGEPYNNTKLQIQRCTKLTGDRPQRDRQSMSHGDAHYSLSLWGITQSRHVSRERQRSPIPLLSQQR
jgi:hypothetical protein